jgi:hypothetical protein
MLIRSATPCRRYAQGDGSPLRPGEFDRERVSAIAVRLIELGWLRVGSGDTSATGRTA